MESLRGVWTALVTPFESNSKKIDWASYRRLLKQQEDAGVRGVIACGTTGESPTLSLEEKKELIQFTLEELNGTKVQVGAGTGSNNTQESVEFSHWASEEGVSAVLVVTPYYNKPTQIGLQKHFEEVADSVHCPVILYNVPGRTGCSLEISTILKLSAHPKIRALKEATGNVAFTSEILAELARNSLDLEILSGDDATFFPLLCVGAHGTISVASHVAPKQMVEIGQAVAQGDLEAGQRIHKSLFPLFRDLFIESNPSPVKFALSEMGICGPTVRSPLVELTEANKIKLKSTIQEYLL
jgi:4-hydroxy-tetrahydrodipicolinate synthase